MGDAMKMIAMGCLSALFLGCAAMFVPLTNDPMRKLVWATDLFNEQSRPLPAERLINEAIDLCQERKDEVCLGKAFVTYGFFFRSPSIEKWRKHYLKHGFMDKSASVETRYQVSKSYFEKGVEHYLKTDQYDKLSNAYLNLGFAYFFLSQPKDECEPYLRALEYHRKNLEKNPRAEVHIPQGYDSFSEYVASLQKLAGCA